jgi:hypothetical protein
MLPHHPVTQTGGYKENFAVSREFIPDSDWLHNGSEDAMHDLLVSGPCAQEGRSSIYIFIKRRKYFTRDELNAVCKSHHWRPGTRVPEFGKYVLEGVDGTLPEPAGRLRFSASQTRHWLENSIIIFTTLFALKDISPSTYEIDPVWISWVALVDMTLSALGDQFDDDELERLDDKILNHHDCFDKVLTPCNTSRLHVMQHVVQQSLQHSLQHIMSCNKSMLHNMLRHSNKLM